MKRLSRHFDPDLICLLLLLAFGLTAYANSFSAAFHYDDITRIVDNDAIIDLANIGGIYSYCKERFLTYFTLALNYRISELEPTSYHIFNFFIHYFAALFLYFLFIETWKTPGMKEVDLGFSKPAAAFFVAGIFLLHPLQTQAVTYVIQRAASMAGMFYLGALLFYVRARLSVPRYAAGGYYALMILCAIGAAFSKETAATLPAMIVIYEIFFFNTSIRDLVRKKVVIFSLIPVGIIVAYKFGSLVQRDFYYDPGIDFTRKQYILTQFSVLVTYLRLFFWPAGQNLDWDYPLASAFFNVRTVASLSLLLALACLALVSYRKSRFLSLGIVAFFVTLAPTSSIIPIKDLIYEHRMYLAVAFLAMGFVHVSMQTLEKIESIPSRGHQVVLVLVIGTLLSLLTGLTYARNQVWMNELSLWRDAVQKSPNKARPHVNYGRALYASGFVELGKIKAEFETANRLCPRCPTPYHNLAFVYWKEGDYQRAIASSLEAIKLKSNYDDALYHLSRMYRELNEWDDARAYLERLISMSPGSKYLRAYSDLVDVYLEMGLENKAISLAQTMTKMEDGVPRLDYYRGIIFYKLQDLEQAKLYFIKAIEHKSKRTSSYLMLGQIHYLQEEYEQAEEAFRKVLEEYPWSAAAHYNLAILLEKSNRSQEAIKHLKHARAVDPFAFGPSFHLIKLYGNLGFSGKRTDLLSKLLGLRPDSKEFSFLKVNQDEDFNQTLSIYAERFLSGNPSPGSVRTRAIIATLREDYPEAIRLYEKHLGSLTDKKEKQKITQEVLRLEGVLQGKEPLITPA
jgi:tetratricopeptide (TPR) repeat protein